MKSSFKHDTIPPETPVPSPHEAVPNDFYSSLEGAQGDFDASEVLTPRLNIVHGVGDLPDTHQLGSLVYNRETELPQPVDITFHGYKKFYVQNISFDAEVRPARFYTQYEVRASGGNLAKKKKDEDPNNFIEGVEAFVAIELPVELSDLAGSINFGDRFFARALWVLQRTAYKRVIRPLNFMASSLRSRTAPDGKLMSITYQPWTLKTEKVTFGDAKVWSPTITPKMGVHSQDVVDFFRSIFS